MQQVSGHYTAIPGTWAFDGRTTNGKWWMASSRFAEAMRKRDLAPVFDDPFVWSTDVNGVGIAAWFGGTSSYNDWEAGAQALAYYLRDVPYTSRNIIAHSHGGQIALMAARNGVMIRNLLTIATPVRKDMQDTYDKARPNIGRWTHVHSDWSDWMQILGGVFDGSLGMRRKMPLADYNIQLPKVGHSSIIEQPEQHSDHWDMLVAYVKDEDSVAYVQ